MAGPLGFFKKVFSGPDVVKDLAGDVTTTLDKFTFTDQERAQADQSYLNFVLEYMKATQPQNLARRYIAFMVVGLWIFLTLVAVAAWPLAKEFSEFVFKVIKEEVDTPFSIIMGFYFFTHVVRTWTRERKGSAPNPIDAGGTIDASGNTTGNG